MHRPAIRYVVYSLACLYLGLAVCVLLVPIGVIYNGGLSYYGTLAKTVLPYALGMIGAGIFGIKAARAIDDFGGGYVRLALIIQSWLLVGILITPYTGGRWIDYIHTTFGTVMFIMQLLLTGWLAFWFLKTWQAYALWFLQLAAAIVAAIYVAPPYGHLTEAQIAFEVIFGILLTYELVKLLPLDHTAEQEEK